MHRIYLALPQSPRFGRRELQQSLASPYANKLHTGSVATAHDPKRRMNQLPDCRLIELGYDSTHLRVFTQQLDPFQDITQKALPDFGNTLLRVPISNALEIRQRGFGDPQNGPWHRSRQAEAFSGFGQAHVPAGLQVTDAFDDGAHELAFLFRILVLRNGLNDSDATASARQQYGTARFRSVLDHTAGVFFQVTERHDVRGESS